MDTTRAFRILAFLCGCMYHFVICENQLRWEKLFLNGTGPGPNARIDAALAFDPKRSTVVLFGGRSKSEVYSDTWLFDLKQKSWKRVNDTVIDLEIIPGPRFGTVHGTDGDRFIIAFGSRDLSNSLSNEVFQYVFNSSKWSRVRVKTGDPNSRFFANGGVFNGSLFVSHGYGTSGILSDVEKLDFRRQVWETLDECVNQYSPFLPHARYAQSSVLLPDRKILMFGGCLSEKNSAGPCPSSDSWLFDIDSKKWSQLQRCPAARRSSSLALLPNSTKTSAAAILFGGDSTSNQIIKVQGMETSRELVIFDNTEKEWGYRTVLEDPRFGLPEPRHGHSMVTTLDGIFVYGGASSKDNKILGDVWLLRGDVNSVKMSPVPRKEGRSSINLITLHGIFMFVSWGILLQLGAFVARYMRHKERIWLKLHRGLNVIGLLLAIAGFGLGVASFRGSHFSFAHGAIGLDIMLAGLYQPLNAAFRPAQPKDGEKPTLWRRIWETSHRFTGRIALLLAIANISLGLFLSLAPKSVWITWFSYIGVIMLIYVCAEVRSKMKMKTMLVAEVGHENIAI